MPRIAVLPPNLVNRIAAGECVERPSSVVKELVENALDAGATFVQVNILDGGRDLIQVLDDGVGMDADDLRLCIHPHATSKIRADDDLFNIHTMGFRGEALPSIGSISRLRIVSRTRDNDAGHVVTVDAGALQGPAPAAAPVGTSVEVRDLFYCVPARRKFLRTNQTEIGHISEQLARIALPHTEVTFTLTHGGRELLNLPTTADRRRRIQDCFAAEIADVLIPIERSVSGLRLEGLIAPPKESRGSSKWEYVFVNGRFVRDKFVSHAVREAYRSLIDPSRYPVVFLFITVDPASVDVNVHPTKIEIRWRDSNFVHSQVLAALRDKFLSMNLDHTLRAPAVAADAHSDGVRAAMIDFFTRARPATADLTGGGFSSALPLRHELPAQTGASVARGAVRPSAPFDLAETGQGASTVALPGVPAVYPNTTHAGPPDFASPFAGSGSDAASGSVAFREFHAQPAPQPGAANDTAVVDPYVAPRRALQVHSTYIVIETADGMMIIDQHALHERILYEELRRRTTGRPLESQRLLIADIVPTPPDRVEALESHTQTLAKLGIELSAAGPRSVAIQAFPTFLERIDRGAFVADLLDVLCEPGARPEGDTLLHRVLDMMACKAAVKAGDPLTAEEIDALLERRVVAERSSHCPHGRPTTLHFSLFELEKQFKRR